MGRVVDGFLAKARARIADPEGHGAGGADGVHLDDLIGIELGAVLHRVDEDLPKRQHDLLTRSLRQLRSKLSGKGHETVSGGKTAVDSDGDPARARGDDFDV